MQEITPPPPRRFGAFVTLIGALMATGGFSYILRHPAADASPSVEASALIAGAAAPLVITQNPDVAREAFTAAYTVYMHARCMNCHPAGDAPLQGDDGVTHSQNVLRGTDGNGKYALKCANCHQDANLSGAHMPPGSAKWHLPPADMRMVFQGKTAGELCRQLKDPAQNGGKTLEQLLEHVSNDTLVLWGWNPGDGRTQPPLTHDEFVAKMRTWIENGAACPD